MLHKESICGSNIRKYGHEGCSKNNTVEGKFEFACESSGLSFGSQYKCDERAPISPCRMHQPQTEGSMTSTPHDGGNGISGYVT